MIMLDELPPIALPPRLLSSWDRVSSPLPRLVRDLLANGGDVAPWPSYIHPVRGGCEQVTLGKHFTYTRWLNFSFERKKVFLDADAVKEMNDSALDFCLRYMIAVLVLLMLEIDPSYCPLLPEIMAGCWTLAATADDEEEE
jgi:hypothetical protein